MPDSLPDTSVHMFSSLTAVAPPAGLKVTPVATITMRAAPLHYYVDVSKDLREVLVGGPSPAFQQLSTASVHFTAVPPPSNFPVQDHNEEAPMSLRLPAAIASQHPSPLNLLLPVLVMFQTACLKLLSLLLLIYLV